jgi:chromosome segregation ATPase
MARISVKIENSLVDKIEEDRIHKGLKLSKWVVNAVQSYLHPPRAGPDHSEKTEELKRISDELLASHAAKETLTSRLADLELSAASLKSERDALAAELTHQKKQSDLVNNKQESSVIQLNQLEKNCGTLQQEKESIRAELTELKSRYDVLKGENDTLAAELTELKSGHASLKSERENLGTELAQQKSTCDRLQGERDQAVADRNMFLTERENLEKQVLEMAVEVERSKAKTIIIDELRKDKDFLQVEYRKLSDHIVPQLPPGRSSFWSWIWDDK